MITVNDNVNILMRSNFSKAVAAEIAYLRKKKGYTGKELAKYVGVSQQQISRYESGISNINVDTLAIILNILGCSLESFFKKVDIRMKEDTQ
ncbi:helix-turn-helix domain-containing protein [Providencia rettgeri]|uniref:helix-turn-helix domain-containing protein n=1 Tax=Providencia rettgeri TaxID=587 RepID=UPI0023627CD5|nr:helix-turn-helix transcriptional regulator [Providencia rettgeri]